MPGKKPLIVAGIPAYNEEKTIAKVIVLTKRYVDKVIVCDDGSDDLTGEIAKELGAIVIRHENNMGVGAATADIFDKARELGAGILVTLDADGQHDPRDIPRLIEPILKGEADIVIGSRFLSEEKEVPKLREFGVKVFTKMTQVISKYNLTDAQSGFRAFNKRALYTVYPTEKGFGVITEILIKAARSNLRVKEVPTTIRYKGLETSTKGILSHGMEVALSILKVASIEHPLKYYGIPGAIIFLASLILWFKQLQIFTQTRQVVVQITLPAIALTLIGLILLTTAIILYTIVTAIKEYR